jgi:hypothetical protein
LRMELADAQFAGPRMRLLLMFLPPVARNGSKGAVFPENCKGGDPMRRRLRMLSVLVGAPYWVARQPSLCL